MKGLPYVMFTKYDNNHYRYKSLYEDDKTRLIIASCIIAGVLLLWGCIHILTYRKTVPVHVSSYYWYRGINIEEWMQIEESGWSVPNGGREIRSYSAYHHTERYACGTTTTGTGTNRRTVTKYCNRSVYQRKYDYYIDKWIVVSRDERQGVTQEDVQWPNVEDLPYKGTQYQPEYGDKRAGQRISQYAILFRDDEESYKAEMTEELWRTFRLDRKYRLVLGYFGNIVEIQK